MQAFVSESLNEYLHSGADNLDIMYWAKRNRSLLPPLQFDCGNEDTLLSRNRALHATLLENGIRHIYEEYEGGHTWEYWKTHVRRTLQFISEIERTGKQLPQAFDCACKDDLAGMHVHSKDAK